MATSGSNRTQQEQQQLNKLLGQGIKRSSVYWLRDLPKVQYPKVNSVKRKRKTRIPVAVVKPGQGQKFSYEKHKSDETTSQQRGSSDKEDSIAEEKEKEDLPEKEDSEIDSEEEQGIDIFANLGDNEDLGLQQLLEEEEVENNYNMAAVTPADLRTILQQVLGDLGPPIDANGQVVQGQPPRVTLTDRLRAQGARAAMSKPPTPETFSGTPKEDPRQWRRKMNDYLALLHTPEADKVRVVSMFLTGAAEVWFNRLTPAQKAVYVDFMDLLQQTFEDMGDSFSQNMQAMNRTLKAGENIETYLTDIMKDATRLQWDDARIQFQLVQGLTPELKSDVIFLRPDGLNDCLEKIRRVAVVNESKPKANVAELTGIKAALTSLVEEIKKPKPQANNVQNSQPRRGGGRFTRNFQPRAPQPIYIQTTPPPVNNNNTGIRCYNCNKMGHMSRDCRQNTGRQQRNNQSQNSNVCFRCASPDHFIKDCPQKPRGQGGRGRGGRGYNGPRRSN